jgi:hypothetical protein
MNKETRTLIQKQFDDRKRINAALARVDTSLGKQLTDSMERIAVRLTMLGRRTEDSAK